MFHWAIKVIDIYLQKIIMLHFLFIRGVTEVNEVLNSIIKTILFIIDGYLE